MHLLDARACGPCMSSIDAKDQKIHGHTHTHLLSLLWDRVILKAHAMLTLGIFPSAPAVRTGRRSSRSLPGHWSAARHSAAVLAMSRRGWDAGMSQAAERHACVALFMFSPVMGCLARLCELLRSPAFLTDSILSTLPSQSLCIHSAIILPLVSGCHLCSQARACSNASTYLNWSLCRR